jgi:hypothetical protein
MKTTANTTANLSAYNIYWAEFTPCTGKYITKSDIAAIEGYASRYTGRYNTNHRKHFANKERALEFINNFNKKLSKRYMVRLFTDKQFGMAKQENGYAIPYTKKQLEEVYYIG